LITEELRQFIQRHCCGPFRRPPTRHRPRRAA
jgi:hypothetical protein